MSAEDVKLARLRARLTSSEDVDLPPESLPRNATTDRPTGRTTMFFGWIGIVGGVVIALLGEIEGTLETIIVGCGISNIGLISLLAGYIVNAISYLPGKPK